MRPNSVRLFDQLSAALKPHRYLLLAIAVGILAIQRRSYAANPITSSEPSFFVSLETAIFFFIGVVISLFYIKGMSEVLRNAVRTYSSDTEDSRDTYTNGITGSILAVIASAVVIWSYGLGPYLLYLGPILCLLSPVGIIYFMALDVQRYKETPSSKQDY